MSGREHRSGSSSWWQNLLQDWEHSQELGTHRVERRTQKGRFVLKSQCPSPVQVEELG